MSMGSDPTQSVRELQKLLTPQCKWSITESRPGKLQFPLREPISVTMTYVTFSYPTASEAPISRRRVKQLILQFNVATNGLLVSIVRLQAGDVFWPIPPLTKEMARDVAIKELDDTALYFHVSLPLVSPDTADEQPWVKVGLPWIGSSGPGDWAPIRKWLSQYREFFQRSSFQVGSFDETYRTGQVQLPASWAKYRLAGRNRQSGGRCYRVDESTEVQILDVADNQQAGTAKAKLRLVHSGCTEACKLVRDLYRTPEFVTNDEPFRVWGNNGWGLFHGNGGNWPQWEEGSVDYRWDEARLRWTVPQKQYISDASFSPMQ